MDAVARAEDGGEPPAGGETLPAGSLSPLRSWVHPADAARAFRLALETVTGRYDCFVLAAADSSSPEPTVAGCERRFGVRPSVRDAARYADDARASAVDCGHAVRVLGWRPERRWREYVEQAAQPGASGRGEP